MDFGAVLTGLNTLTSIANSGMNIYSAYKQDKRQDEANQYTRELNNLMMQREDNALQRRLDDVKAAGFSPLVAANLGGAGTGTFTQLGTASGDYANSLSGLSDSLKNASDTYLSAKQQRFTEKQWQDLADERNYDKQLKGVELAKAAIDLQHYAQEKNLTMQAQTLANGIAQKTLDSADQVSEDAHNESVERVNASKKQRSYLTSQIKKVTQDISESGARIDKMKKEGEYIDKQKEYSDTLKLVQEAAHTAQVNENLVFERLDAIAKEKGYKNFQAYYYDNIGKQQLYDNVIKGINSVSGVFGSASKFIK